MMVDRCSSVEHKLFDFNTQKIAFEGMKSRYVACLIDKIDRRFPVNTTDIQSWFTVLEPKKASVAKQSSENFSLYGAETFENLLTHSLQC